MGIEDNVIPDALVESIINEPKYLSSRVDLTDLSVPDNGSHRMKNVRLECDAYECSMRIRQSVDRPSNFSVILVYKDSNKNDRVILRLNGDHGRHRNRIEGDVVEGPHIHRMTERYQRRTTHPDGYAQATDSYSSLEEAIDEFLRMSRIRIVRSGRDKNNTRLEEFQ